MQRSSRGISGMWRHIGIAVSLWCATTASPAAQALTYASGQRLAPAYEGWVKNEDGSVDLWFGYMNQNWQEEIDIPVGPDNTFAPAAADAGQPTHFLPRRNRFVFKVRAPQSLGSAEMVWTLTHRGITLKAYASLKPDYALEQMTLISEKGGIGSGVVGTDEARRNKPPKLTVEGAARRTVGVGKPLIIVAQAVDDGLPRPRAAQNQSRLGTAGDESLFTAPQNVTVNSAVGLRLSWFVYRGNGAVGFDPPQIEVWEDTRDGANSPWAPRWVPPAWPADGRVEVTATFNKPGEYVLRCLADDGGLWDQVDIAVTVTP